MVVPVLQMTTPPALMMSAGVEGLDVCWLSVFGLSFVSPGLKSTQRCSHSLVRFCGQQAARTLQMID